MKLTKILAGFLAVAALASGCDTKVDVGPATISIDKETASVEKSASTIKVVVTSNYEWAAKCDQPWVTVSPESGSACPSGAEVSILVADNSGEESVDRSAVVTFYGNNSRLVSAAISINQVGSSKDAIKSITVADFIKNADTQTRYRLTGTVSNVITSNFTTFELSDASGASVLVYSFDQGIMPEKDVENGATITLTGIYKYYDSKKQHEVVNAVIEEYTAPEKVDRSKIATISCAEFISKADPQTYYRLKGTVTRIQSGTSSSGSSYYYFYISDDNGKSEVEMYTASKDNKKPFTEVEKGATVTVSGYYAKYQKDASSPVIHEMLDTIIEEYTAPEKVDRSKLATISCAEFISKADTKNYYRLKGAVTKVQTGSNYCYFFISDDNGASEVEIYEASKDNTKPFTEVVVGANVTVSGYYAKYQKNADSPVYHEMLDAVIEEYSVPEVKPVETEKIADVVAAAKGVEVTLKNVLVAAASQVSFLVTDGTDYMLAYGPEAAATVKVGDKVTIKANKDTYGGQPQLTSPAVEVVSSGNELPAVTAKDITSGFDSYKGTVGEYVKVKGILSITSNDSGTKYYNIAVDGASTLSGSLPAPLASLNVDSFDGQQAMFEGYYIYTVSSKYVNIVLTKVEADASDYFTVNPETISVAADATSASFKINTNLAWTCTSKTEGFTVSDASGTGVKDVTVSFAANTDTEKAKTATIEVVTSLGKKTVTITQAKKAAGPEGLTHAVTTNIAEADFVIGTNAYKNTVTVNGSTDTYFCFRVGKSKTGGSGTIKVPAGTKKIGFYGVAWKGETVPVSFKNGSTEVKKVTLQSNEGASGSASTYPLVNVTDANAYFEIEFETALSAVTEITVTTENSNPRALLFGINAYTE